MQFPSKSQWLSSQRLKKIYPKVHLETQETTNSQHNTQQKDQCWRYHNTWLETILQSNSNKNSKVPAQKQKWKPVNRIEDLDMNPHNYTHLIFDKEAKNTWWRKDSLFNKCCWEKWLSICKKLKLDPCLSPCTNINLKWIKDLNIRSEILKLVQEGAGNTLELIGIGKNFLNRTPAAQQLRERMDKKFICTTKEMISKLKRPPTE
jgi:hypothetical protein